MATDYSDAALTISAQGTSGYARADRALLTVPESVRADIVTEGSIRANVIGGRYADGIEDAARRWLTGQHDYPYTEANSAMLAREAARKAQTGRLTVEPFHTTFAHLPHHA